jgi:hypothetical protein
VEQRRELLFADQLSQPLRRGHIARRQRSQRRRVEHLGLTGGRDLLAGAIDQEDELRVRLLAQPFEHLGELLVVLRAEYQIGTGHGSPGSPGGLGAAKLRPSANL